MIVVHLVCTNTYHRKGASMQDLEHKVSLRLFQSGAIYKFSCSAGLTNKKLNKIGIAHEKRHHAR